jgi:hypothetical protein
MKMATNYLESTMKKHIPANSNRIPILLPMLTGLCLTLQASILIGAPQGDELTMHEAVKCQLPSSSYEMPHPGGLQKTQLEQIQTGLERESKAKTVYGQPPIRALQIPGHVLEAITSNMGTEFMTVD